MLEWLALEEWWAMTHSQIRTSIGLHEYAFEMRSRRPGGDGESKRSRINGVPFGQSCYQSCFDAGQAVRANQVMLVHCRGSRVSLAHCVIRSFAVTADSSDGRVCGIDQRHRGIARHHRDSIELQSQLFQPEVCRNDVSQS